MNENKRDKKVRGEQEENVETIGDKKAKQKQKSEISYLKEKQPKVGQT